jgi:hypothetical protein
MKVLNNTVISHDKDEYVYDISLDGTFVNALGMNVAKQTDGFNFQMPDTYKYTEENPYISTGKGRNYKKGDKFTTVEADVAEFEDLFLRGKMGLGIDEYADATINFSRKNYADLLAGDEVKYVGNTIKSKRMPGYIERFMEKGIIYLLHGNGKEFLDFYYDYIEKIYNYEIPLREIASKGKIKKSVSDYKKDCKTLTKAGIPKSRQVWYELCVNNNLDPTIGDTIYFINTGDGKKKTTYKDVEKKKIKGKNGEPDTIKIINNCVMLDNNVVEAEEDTFCTDTFEYNAPKYIESFNKRINPILVCFSPNIRNRILIKTPDQRQYFTEKDAELDSGHPNKVEDQDSYEQLLTMEDKEIAYWVSINEIPTYAKELGFEWDKIVSSYKERMEKLKDESIAIEVNKYKEIIECLTKKEADDFISDANIPKSITEFLKLDINNMNLVSKKYDIPIGSIYDITDKDFSGTEYADTSEE